MHCHGGLLADGDGYFLLAKSLDQSERAEKLRMTMIDYLDTLD